MNVGARVKPEFGPMLPALLEQRLIWIPRRIRSILAAATLVVALIVAVGVARGGAATLSRSAPGVAFSFAYTALHQEPTPAGEYALLEASADGALSARLEVGPLRLPRYFGDLSGVEPVIAAADIRTLAARIPSFALRSEGPTVLGGLAAYNFTYTRTIDGASYFGRVILVTPRFTGARLGLTVSMLAQPVRAGLIGPGAAALAGALYEPGQGGVGVLFQPDGILSRPLATFQLSGT